MTLFSANALASAQDLSRSTSLATETYKAACQLARLSFIDFVARVTPWFIIEEIHLIIAEAFERLADPNDPLDRLMIFLPPRAGKSELAKLFQAWYFGKYPWRMIMMVSHTTQLAAEFGGDVRDMVADETFNEIFPEVGVRSNRAARDVWEVRHGEEDEKNGRYFAAGVGRAAAGRGFHLGVVDDLLSEQTAMSQVEKDKADNYYLHGFYNRQQEVDAAILVINTRWATDDIAGRRLDEAEAAKAEGDEWVDQWEVISFPAVLETTAECAKLNTKSADVLYFDELREKRMAAKEHRKPRPVKQNRFKVGDSFAPRRWPLPKLYRLRANMTKRFWDALYRQQPTDEAGNIMLKKDWRKWAGAHPPECQMVVTCYDTAFEEGEENDYSARTTWGVFQHGGRMCCILLERWRDKLGFPDLRAEVLRHNEDFEPDLILIERRASGHALLKELQRTRAPVMSWLPPGQKAGLAEIGRRKGKLQRAHAASVFLDQGAVYYMDRRWAEEVIDECAAFPFADSDDVCDTVTMMLIWMRMHGQIELQDEFQRELEEEESEEVEPQPRRRLYGGGQAA